MSARIWGGTVNLRASCDFGVLMKYSLSSVGPAEADQSDDSTSENAAQRRRARARQVCLAGCDRR